MSRGQRCQRRIPFRHRIGEASVTTLHHSKIGAESSGRRVQCPRLVNPGPLTAAQVPRGCKKRWTEYCSCLVIALSRLNPGAEPKCKYVYSAAFPARFSDRRGKGSGAGRFRHSDTVRSVRFCDTADAVARCIGRRKVNSLRRGRAIRCAGVRCLLSRRDRRQLSADRAGERIAMDGAASRS